MPILRRKYLIITTNSEIIHVCCTASQFWQLMNHIYWESCAGDPDGEDPSLSC